jgi:hypothetical protein
VVEGLKLAPDQGLGLRHLVLLLNRPVVLLEVVIGERDLHPQLARKPTPLSLSSFQSA